VATATASGDGAANAVAHITGTTATKMLWPEDSIPSTFTVCSVTRYTGGARGRNMGCMNSPTQSLNWLQGHYSSMRGVALYNVWQTAQTNTGIVDDWLVMCGTNDAAVAFPGNIIMDQDEIGITSGGLGGCRLNFGYAGSTDWALHSLLIWDYALGTAPVPFHATPYVSNPSHCVCRREPFHGTVQCSLHPLSQGWVTGDGQTMCVQPGGGGGNNRALTRPRNPRMARDKIRQTLDTPVPWPESQGTHKSFVFRGHVPDSRGSSAKSVVQPLEAGM
jgi:hypothetical protein